MHSITFSVIIISLKLTHIQIDFKVKLKVLTLLIQFKFDLKDYNN